MCRRFHRHERGTEFSYVPLDTWCNVPIQGLGASRSSGKFSAITSSSADRPAHLPAFWGLTGPVPELGDRSPCLPAFVEYFSFSQLRLAVFCLIPALPVPLFCCAQCPGQFLC